MSFMCLDVTVYALMLYESRERTEVTSYAKIEWKIVSCAKPTATN